ncbi:hypothetical protein Ae406Ps2_6449 [Pseudonocardia sp. Ae406_Ps2]|nr:hypothetical protein Ae406Ps2_6449 [Pseudonocardia sp. Ae406_Ps2]
MPAVAVRVPQDGCGLRRSPLPAPVPAPAGTSVRWWVAPRPPTCHRPSIAGPRTVVIAAVSSGCRSGWVK